MSNGTGEASPLRMDFLPVFDCRRERVNTFYCRPSLVGADGKVLADDALLGMSCAQRRVNEATAIRVMSRTLGLAADRVPALVAADPDMKLIIPVNGFALTLRGVAAAFAERCRGFGRDFARTAIFEVTNIDDENRQSFLDDIAVVLMPFCMSWGARIRPQTQDLKLYSTCNYSGIALDLKDKPWPIEAVRPYLSDLAERTNMWRLKAYVHGIGSAAIFDLARGSGIRFLSGKAVGEAHPEAAV